MVDPFIKEDVIEVEKLEETKWRSFWWITAKRQIVEVIEVAQLGRTKRRYSPYV